MNVQLLFLLYALSSLGGILFSKQCSNVVASGNKERYLLFFLVNSGISCLFFFFNGGIGVQGNLLTLTFALLFAAVVLLSLLSTLLGYQLLHVSGVNVITGSCSLITTSLIGCLMFSEPMNWRVALRILIMIAAGVFTFWDGRSEKSPSRSSSKKQSLLLLFAVLLMKVVASTANTLITKAYAQDNTVADENSFFFWTNFLLGIVALTLFLVRCRKKSSVIRDAASVLKPKQMIYFSGNTICANVGSLISLWLLAQVNVSVFTPLSSAVGILIGVLASLLLREKLGFFSYLAAFLACVAMVL